MRQRHIHQLTHIFVALLSFFLLPSSWSSISSQLKWSLPAPPPRRALKAAERGIRRRSHGKSTHARSNDCCSQLSLCGAVALHWQASAAQEGRPSNWPSVICNICIERRWIWSLTVDGRWGVEHTRKVSQSRSEVQGQTVARQGDGLRPFPSKESDARMKQSSKWGLRSPDSFGPTRVATGPQDAGKGPHVLPAVLQYPKTVYWPDTVRGGTFSMVQK